MRLPAWRGQLQDVFLQLHAALSLITGEEHLTRWLLRTVTHRCIDRQRHAGRRLRLVPIAAMPPTFEPAAALLHIAIHRR